MFYSNSYDGEQGNLVLFALAMGNHTRECKGLKCLILTGSGLPEYNSTWINHSGGLSVVGR